MIKRLSLKFTLLVLGGLLIIIIGVVFIINYSNWRDITQQAQRSLQTLTENNGQRPGLHQRGERPIPPPNGETSAEIPQWMDEDGFLHIPFFDHQQENVDFAADLSTFYTVTLDSNGEILQWNSDRSELYSDQQVRETVDAVAEQGKKEGLVNSQFYRKKELSDGSLLVVLDARMELSHARSLLKNTVLVGVLTYLVLGLSAVFVIRRMTRPVQVAFDKQKQFVWDASHELKTPLAVISANAEVLAGEIGENEWLSYIQSEVRRTNHLVENLLTLARMDRGTVQAEHQLFDLSQAVLQVALPFESTVFEAGKTIEMDIQEKVSCRGDRDMIQQLTVILLSNAVKYSDEKGEITLSLQNKGDQRVLRVHNTGPAMEPDVLPHIFDRFYRGDSAHNRENPGNGLGLAIAQTIVEAHKGKIQVESVEGKGTTFTVYLP